MGQPKLKNGLHVDHAYVSKNGKSIFLVIRIADRSVHFQSFDSSDGTFEDIKIWKDTTFRDRIEREATSDERSMLEVQSEDELGMRDQIFLHKVSKLALILEVQRRGLIEDILSGVASEDQFLAAARSRGFDLIKKDD
jgi:hypothetical protein